MAASKTEILFDMIRNVRNKGNMVIAREYEKKKSEIRPRENLTKIDKEKVAHKYTSTRYPFIDG